MGPTLLYFGCRNKAQDYIYQTELEGWQEEGLLSLYTAFSRDQEQKRYVTHCLRETGAEVWQLLQQGAHLYVCGDAKMMAKVSPTPRGLIFQAKVDLSGREEHHRGHL